MATDLDFENAGKMTTTNKGVTWSNDTIDDLVDRHFKQRAQPPLLSAKPIQRIALVGAVQSDNDILKLRDRDYIDVFFSQLAQAGLPVDPDVSVTNYNLHNGTDIFDRNEPIDALLICNLNSKWDEGVNSAPIYQGGSDEHDHHFHVSAKSLGQKAWAELAEKLEIKIVAVYGFGRCVGIGDFVLGKGVNYNYLSDPNNPPQSGYDKWKKATNGTRRDYRRLTPDELKKWVDDPLPVGKGSDMRLCKNPCVLSQYQWRPSSLGQDGSMHFALSREFLDAVSDPKFNALPLLKSIESTSVLGSEITRHALERSAGGYLELMWNEAKAVRSELTSNPEMPVLGY